MSTAALSPYVPSSLAEAERLAQRLSQSALVPDALRGKPGDILVILMSGHELGLSPMASLRGLAVINGRPVMGADLAVSLVKRHPRCRFFRLVESSADRATYETERDGEGKTQMTWTLQQAKAAGLADRGPWRAHPAAMLRARAALSLARAVYPDVLLGVYSDDEGEEMAGPPAQAVEPVQAAPAGVITGAVDALPEPHNDTPALPETTAPVDPAAEREAAIVAMLGRFAEVSTPAELRRLGGPIKDQGIGNDPRIRDGYASRHAQMRRAGGVK